MKLVFDHPEQVPLNPLPGQTIRQGAQTLQAEAADMVREGQEADHNSNEQQLASIVASMRVIVAYDAPSLQKCHCRQSLIQAVTVWHPQSIGMAVENCQEFTLESMQHILLSEADL